MRSERRMMTTTHKLVNPDGTPYLSESDKRFKDLRAEADDMIFRIQNMTKQLDICVIRVGLLEGRMAGMKNIVGRLEERLANMKNIMKVMWTTARNSSRSQKGDVDEAPVPRRYVGDPHD